MHFHEMDESERHAASPRVLKIPQFIQQLLSSQTLQHQRAALAAIVQLN